MNAALSPADTLTDRAATLIRRDILAGELPPGSRLGVHGLVARYAISATPIREALSRLASRDLIIAIGQRGFRVAPLSREDLADITRVRIVLETEALRLSLARGGDEWEAGIVAGLHRLKAHVTRDVKDVREGSAAFDALHKAFHAALVAASGSPRLTQGIADLYDQAYRYRRIMMKGLADPARFVAAHERLAEVVLARDFEPARAELAAHVRSTLAHVYPGEPCPEAVTRP